LNKTKKKDREWKEGIISQVRNAVDRCAAGSTRRRQSPPAAARLPAPGIHPHPLPATAPPHPHTLPPSYPNIYVFRFHNMRNEKFKELRDELKDSSRCVWL
jgi:hypothetical protein